MSLATNPEYWREKDCSRFDWRLAQARGSSASGGFVALPAEGDGAEAHAAAVFRPPRLEVRRAPIPAAQDRGWMTTATKMLGERGSGLLVLLGDGKRPPRRLFPSVWRRRFARRASGATSFLAGWLTARVWSQSALLAPFGAPEDHTPRQGSQTWITARRRPCWRWARAACLFRLRCQNGR